MYDGMEMEDAARISAAHRQLRDTMLFRMPEQGEYGSTLLHGFTAARRDRAGYGAVAVPSIGLVVQGSRYLEGEPTNGVYDACRCFVDCPAAWENMITVPHSSTEPYLALTIAIDEFLLNGLMQRSEPIMPIKGSANHAITAKADLATVDAFLRLMNLMDTPELFMYLAPLVVREIHFRMLTGPLGRWMRHLHVHKLQHCVNPNFSPLS